MLAAFGAPAVGSLGVGCGFSDSGERPLEVIGVEENERMLGIERIRGA
jgi:hypothetical protein